VTLDRPEIFQGKMAVFTPKYQGFFKSVKPFKKKLQFRSKKPVSKTDFLAQKWSGFDLTTLLEVFAVL
jgi:hypothetical protein